MNLLILGGGRTVWEDYFQAKELFDTYEIMCVNDIAGQFQVEKIQHICALHYKLIPGLKQMRIEKHMVDESYTSHSITDGEGVDRVWDKSVKIGNSGMFAIAVGLSLGYDKIIACGVPQDNSGRYFDPPADKVETKTWINYGKKCNKDYVVKLFKDFKTAKDNVRSMGGLTAETFGKPTKEWANGSNK